MTIACEDVVDIELPQGPVQLVVDAELSRAVGGMEATIVVDLSLTTDFYAEDITKVSDAVVVLHTGSEQLSVPQTDPGIYAADLAVRIRPPVTSRSRLMPARWRLTSSSTTLTS